MMRLLLDGCCIWRIDLKPWAAHWHGEAALNRAAWMRPVELLASIPCNRVDSPKAFPLVRRPKIRAGTKPVPHFR
jgi:hypothetical protein